MCMCVHARTCEGSSPWAQRQTDERVEECACVGGKSFKCKYKNNPAGGRNYGPRKPAEVISVRRYARVMKHRRLLKNVCAIMDFFPSRFPHAINNVSARVFKRQGNDSLDDLRRDATEREKGQGSESSPLRTARVYLLTCSSSLWYNRRCRTQSHTRLSTTLCTFSRVSWRLDLCREYAFFVMKKWLYSSDGGSAPTFLL